MIVKLDAIYKNNSGKSFFQKMEYNMINGDRKFKNQGS